MALFSPLDLKNIFIVDLAGTPEIFSFVALILIGIIISKVGFKESEALFMFAIFGIIMGTYLSGLYIIINLIGGIVIYYQMKRIAK